ncbi:cuticle protein 19.8-like isoform X3 [Penaeus monodon]|uniref:cuticle protein 19.8-like isoform X1 n=1 Tax=Penaeus monodon TaxID=6687 RepID=UPI0018A7DB05|nr:cuticle protein 19.8-like isoform X1 [Penaeus monodon]XP_037778369.1 cuticle protein 19.8-like isoform X2 [Penaeus monodon]XP_037778370.1 cuticle protein 19.8-like isoform X3 [Penaeus monodon]
MNALTVISVAALVASGSASLLAYNGVYGGHHGLLGAYPYAGYSALHPYSYAGVHPYSYAGGLLAAAPLNLKTPVINTVAPAPVSYNVAPFAPVAPIQSQYHAQDELGQYSFGYAGGPSSRAESRDAFGVVRGSYNYVDSEGKIQTQHYVADALGFRVSGTNLPVAPDAPVTAPLAALPGPLPEPVQDTPEVAAAKAAHQQAYDEAAAAAAAAPDTRKKRSVLAAPGFGVYSPLRFSYGFSTPLHYAHSPTYASPLHYTAAHPALTNYKAAHVPTTYATAAGPALRDADLLRVVHNPGHATSYRVHN